MRRFQRVLSISVVLLALSLPGSAQTEGVSYVIDTVVGSDVFEDNGQAIDTWLWQPEGVAIDALGDVYVADTDRHRILRIDDDGSYETVAGTGLAIAGPDGGLAVNSNIFRPEGMAFGPDGSLYFAGADSRVRKIGPDGILTTVAGTGRRGFSGDGGPAVEAQLDLPFGIAVAVDATIYIADRFNERVRKVSPEGIITTVAGDGTRGFSGDAGPAVAAQLATPQGVTLCPGGDLYIADSDNRRVRVVDDSGEINTFVGSAFAVEEVPVRINEMRAPTAVACDGQGDLYIADEFGERVFVVRVDDLTFEVLAGTGETGFSGDGGPGDQAELYRPRALAVGGGSVFVADSNNHRIREISGGMIDTTAGRAHLAGDGGPATEASLDGPEDVAVDEAGNLYIADRRNHALRHVSAGGMVSTLMGDGIPGFEGDGGPATEGRLFSPVSVLVDGDSRVFVSDSSNRRVRVIDGGQVDTYAGDGGADDGEDNVPAVEAGVSNPAGLAVDSDENLLIADVSGNKLRGVSPEGTISTLAGTGTRGFAGDGGAAVAAQFSSPEWIAVAPDQSVYVSDSSNNRIRRIDPNGTIETVVGGGEELLADGVGALDVRIFFPDDLTFDQEGRLIVAFASNSRLYRLEPEGTLTHIAGAGFGFGGDGGPAREALFRFAGGLTSDEDGNIYLADQNNNRIRKLTPVTTRINDEGVVNAGAIAFSVALDTVAPESIVSIFGIGLSFVIDGASSLPLPTELGGVTVEVTDSSKAKLQAGLFAVTPNQINCLIPAEAVPGPATITVHSGGGASSTADIQIVSLAPGLFTANGTGQGVAAASAFRRDANLVDTPVAVFDTSVAPFQPMPIDLGVETDIVVLSLFGTGLRSAQTPITVTIGGEPAQVFGVVPSPQFEGVEQINVGIPRTLIGRGVVDVQVTVDGVPLNVVTISIL